MKLNQFKKFGALIGALSCAGSLLAQTVGQWDFNGNLSQTTGASLGDLQYNDTTTTSNTVFGSTTDLGISSINGTNATVMKFPSGTSPQGYGMPTPSGNGGGSLVNQYTIIMDVYYPQGGILRPLVETDDGSSDNIRALWDMAALLSTPFDAMGAVGILALGWLLDRLTGTQRKWLLFSILIGVAILIFSLPILVHHQLWMVIAAIGLIGLLSYGPYSLLAGVLSLEVGGKECVASVAGMVDASGYLAGIISGYVFGRILDLGGYHLGFQCLAATTVVGAFLCLALNRPRNQNSISIK